MNNLMSQIRFLKAKKKSFADPLINWTQISFSQSNQKVKILFRQKNQSYWKYCIAPIIFNSILYTFLKIYQTQTKQQISSHSHLFQIEICLDTLKQPQKSLFYCLQNKEFSKVIRSIETFSSNTFSCEIKNPQNNSKRLLLKFQTQKQCKEVCQKILKTSFFSFFTLIDRLKAYQKMKIQRNRQISSDLYDLRYSIASTILTDEDQKSTATRQNFSQFKEHEQKANLFCLAVSLPGNDLFKGIPSISMNFTENLEKRSQLQKKYQQAEEKRKKTINKQKIFSNIQIQKEQNLNGFCIQTKFSIITQCSLVFKIIQTHMNRRNNFQKSAKNAEYFNYLVNIAKKQSAVCVRKKPLYSSFSSFNQKSIQPQQQENKAEQEMIQKTIKILKTQKNCLNIMKESWVANICPYYVHYKQEDTLYSKMYKMSLAEWKQQNDLPCNDQILMDIFLQILNGLYEMKAHNIIHRDLKPDNILIDDSNPAKPVIKLIDFGSTIFIHSESQKYQQEVLENFDPKLRTTKPYNIDLNEFRKICRLNQPLKIFKYSESSFNRHAKFDIYSVGKIMEDFLQKIKDQQVLNNLKFLIQMCTSPDPQYRLGLQETALFLSTIKQFFFSQ